MPFIVHYVLAAIAIHLAEAHLPDQDAALLVSATSAALAACSALPRYEFVALLAPQTRSEHLCTHFPETPACKKNIGANEALP